MLRKYLPILSFLILVGQNCRRDANIAEGSHETNKLNDINSILFAEDFGVGASFYALTLKFEKTNTFRLSYDSEGWYWHNSGTFIREGNRVRLKSDYCGQNDAIPTPCNQTFQSGYCELRNTPDSFEFLYEIVCVADRDFVIFMQADEPSRTIHIPVRKYKVPTGERRKFEGIDIATMGNAKGRVTEPVIMRSGPGIKYKRRHYVINDYEDEGAESIPRDSEVIVHARTVNKSKVKSWENYWYLITAGESEKAWAFAEFIKL